MMSWKLHPTKQCASKVPPVPLARLRAGVRVFLCAGPRGKAVATVPAPTQRQGQGMRRQSFGILQHPDTGAQNVSRMVTRKRAAVPFVDRVSMSMPRRRSLKT